MSRYKFNDAIIYTPAVPGYGYPGPIPARFGYETTKRVAIYVVANDGESVVRRIFTKPEQIRWAHARDPRISPVEVPAALREAR